MPLLVGRMSFIRRFMLDWFMPIVVNMERRDYY